MTLPAALDAGTARAVAMDLDRTIPPETLSWRPRLIAAVKAVAAAAIVATGRMLRIVASLRPAAGRHSAPLICYQGALIADPQSGEWLAARADAGAARREVIEACRKRYSMQRLHVDDEL